MLEGTAGAVKIVNTRQHVTQREYTWREAWRATVATCAEITKRKAVSSEFQEEERSESDESYVQSSDVSESTNSELSDDLEAPEVHDGRDATGSEDETAEQQAAVSANGKSSLCPTVSSSPPPRKMQMTPPVASPVSATTATVGEVSEATHVSPTRSISLTSSLECTQKLELHRRLRLSVDPITTITLGSDDDEKEMTSDGTIIKCEPSDDPTERLMRTYRTLPKEVEAQCALAIYRQHMVSVVAERKRSPSLRKPMETAPDDGVIHPIGTSPTLDTPETSNTDIKRTLRRNILVPH